ncbi:CIA30 family protein [Luteolibacter sp. AS25]|uniref:CIA30 family protein n=1 Tax=Luteolibacter sp. AS25 TaxID=3135776 RepID=UPI00398ADFB4
MKFSSLFLYPVFLLGFGLGGNAKEVEMISAFGGDEGEAKWFPVDDGVMGGVSKGGLEVKEGNLIFSGEISLKNNGGFSSLRKVVKGSDFSGKDGFVMRVKGDGRTYKMRIETDARFNGSEIGYQVDFETKDGEFIEVRVPFASFEPGWRGRDLDGPPMDLSKVEEIGLVLADGKEGEFKIEVDWIGVE